MSIKFISVPSKRLAQTINATDYSFVLDNIKGWGGTDLSASDFGSELYVSFRNSANTKVEFMKVDPATIADSSITILKRGLAYNGEQATEVPANIQDVWVKGDTIVELGSHVPQLLQETMLVSGDQTVGGKKTFSSVPATTGGNAVAGTDLVPYSQALALLTGTANVDRIVVAGTAGETLAAGNLVYLKESDGRWWKADADSASSAENVILGFAQGSGTAGNPVSGGILLWGVDSNQAGLTANSTYYVSNTAGAISLTVGTKEVTAGFSLSTTSILFNPRYNQQITENQQDALTGTNGSPSDTNRYVTDSDTFGPTTSRILRSSVRNGGDGSDGALAISSGTTTIDLGGAAIFVKNYTSISITGTGSLAFTNPHANGTVIVLKSQGDVTITSSSSTAIDLRNMGGAGGAAGSVGTTGVGGAGAGGASMANDGIAGGGASAPNGTAGTAGNTGNGIFVKTTGGTGGALSGTSAGGQLLSGTVPSKLTARGLPLAAGAGGGGAAGGNNAVSGAPGAGGRGAGTLYIECAGAYNFTTGTINASGTNGAAGAATFGSGGGGGGAGCVIVSCGSITANSGTYTLTGGAGGGTTSGAAGAAGGAGASLVFVNTEFN